MTALEKDLIATLEKIVSHVPGRPGHSNLADCHAQMLEDAQTMLSAIHVAHSVL